MPASLPSTITYRSSPGTPRLFASRAVTLWRLTRSSSQRTSAFGAWAAGTRKTRYTEARTPTSLLSVHSSSRDRVNGKIRRKAPTIRNASGDAVDDPCDDHADDREGESQDAQQRA